MAVKLSVKVPGYWLHHNWWVNFCMAEVDLKSDDRNYDYPLSKWGGKNGEGPYIEFENDADATAFLLRWS